MRILAMRCAGRLSLRLGSHQSGFKWIQLLPQAKRLCHLPCKSGFNLFLQPYAEVGMK